MLARTSLPGAADAEEKLYGSVLAPPPPHSAPLLLTDEWQTKIMQKKKKEEGEEAENQQKARRSGTELGRRSASVVCRAQASALSQLIFFGKARSTEWLEGLYITGCVFLTDKPSLTFILT